MDSARKRILRQRGQQGQREQRGKRGRQAERVPSSVTDRASRSAGLSAADDDAGLSAVVDGER
jgi:hypothetical protein